MSYACFCNTVKWCGHANKAIYYLLTSTSITTATATTTTATANATAITTTTATATATTNTATAVTTTTATTTATATTATTTTKWKRKNSGKSDEEPLGKTYSFHYSDWYIFIFISKYEEQNVITLLVEIRKRRRWMKKENERMYLARYNVSFFVLFCFLFYCSVSV